MQSVFVQRCLVSWVVVVVMGGAQTEIILKCRMTGFLLDSLLNLIRNQLKAN